MSIKYQHLLSPIKVGNHVFKNRMIATTSSPHFLQGPESFPNDAIITSYVNKAKSGAAMVVISDVKPLNPRPPDDVLKNRAEHPNEFNPDHAWYAGSGRTYEFDIVNGGCQNYLSHLLESIHFYDAKCIMKTKIMPPRGHDVSLGNPPDLTEAGSGGGKSWGKEITEDMLGPVLDDAELQAVLIKEMGFDGVYIHMAYQASLAARFLSPFTNRRKDKYGGSPENRARFSLELLDRVKKRCGKDFLILVTMSSCEPEGGYTTDEMVEYAKMFAPNLDLLMIRGPRNDLSHPTSFTSERTPFLYAAEKVKKSVPGLAVVANGGFQDLDLCEETIASGKVDFIGMARSWICNTDYGRLAYEGRNEDVVPCLRCNVCQLPSYYKPWTSICVVNPVWGLEHRIDKMISPPQNIKKVAVVGGGTAGMEAALIASQRGHKVTLYEKTGSLGGLLNAYENISFKWPHKDFKNHLILQIAKARVRVCLNTETDPERIKKEGYDAIIAAVGAEPVIPDIPGIGGKNVVFAADVYGKEDSLAKDITILGGGQTGMDTGVHLAQKGHNVTVLEMTNMVARDAAPLFFYYIFKEAWEKLPNFKPIVNARCTGITRDGVTYIDADDKEQSVKAGSVVIAVGMKAKTDLALKFHGAGGRLYMVGDCSKAGDIQRAMRSAFSAACTL